MSVITVQLGQCGNQVGTQLFSKLFQDACSPSSPTHYKEVALDRFFYHVSKRPSSPGEFQARAVLVDMESKVVYNSLADARREGCYSFDTKSVYSEKSGSGNNWANGYLKHGPASKEAILNVVRRQVERCDQLDSFLVLMSVAGGTGSGVGAKLTEYLRDVYPNNTFLNIVVWPYSSGEVIVQDYNSLLTMSHLQSNSNAILLLQNEQMHSVCSRLLHMQKISLADINSIAAHTLASILQPALPFQDKHCGFSSTDIAASKTKSSGSGILEVDDSLFYSCCRPSNLVSNLCPHPLFKLLSAKAIPHILDSTKPYTSYVWSVILKNLRQMLLTDSPTDLEMDWAVDPIHGPGRSRYSSRSRFNKSLANLLVLRGNELIQADPSLFKEPCLYSRLVPSSRTCSVWCSSNSFSRYEKCCTLVSNSQSSVPPLDDVCGKAWNMFSSRAYVHQYERFGLAKEDFMCSFVAIEQVIKDYRELSS